MKFPRNARIFRGHLDAAPFAGVFFLMIIFVLLASLVYTPGFLIKLPEVSAAAGVSGVAGPTVVVAMAADGELFFENQVIQKEELRRRLIKAAQKSQEPLTLVIEADKDVTHEMEVQLAALARDPKVGINQVLWKTLPRVFDAPTRALLQP